MKLFVLRCTCTVQIKRVSEREKELHWYKRGDEDTLIQRLLEIGTVRTPPTLPPTQVSHTANISSVRTPASITRRTRGVTSTLARLSIWLPQDFRIGVWLDRVFSCLQIWVERWSVLKRALRAAPDVVSNWSFKGFRNYEKLTRVPVSHLPRAS